MSIQAKDIGTNIRVIRKSKQYSQEYVAVKLSLSDSGYSKIERGESNLSIKHLLQLSEIFDMDIASILGIKETSIPENHQLVLSVIEAYRQQVEYLQNQINIKDLQLYEYGRAFIIDYKGANGKVEDTD